MKNKRTSTVSGRPFKEGQYLSCEAMNILKLCAEEHIRSLEKQHWNTLRFFTAKTKTQRNAETQIIHEMAKESRKTANAIGELLDIYVYQFPDGKKELEEREARK